VVERTIGILKRRFACLSTKLYYVPQKVGEMVVACSILHNLCINYGHGFEVEMDEIQHNEDNEQLPADNVAGLAFRTAFFE
jgi:hypothetical protein